jgi:hypothetical protein
MKVLAVILIVLGAVMCLGGAHGLLTNDLDHTKGTAYMMGELFGKFLFLGVGVLFLILGIRLVNQKK